MAKIPIITNTVPAPQSPIQKQQQPQLPTMPKPLFHQILSIRWLLLMLAITVTVTNQSAFAALERGPKMLSILRELNLPKEASSAQFLTALVNSTRATLAERPASLHDQQLRLEKLEKIGFDRLQLARMVNIDHHQQWMNSDVWISYRRFYNTIVRFYDKTSEPQTFATLQNQALTEGPADEEDEQEDQQIAPEQRWRTLKELLDSSQRFVAGITDRILQDDLYHTEAMRKSRLTPAAIFHQDIVHHFPTIAKNSEVLKLWFDVVLILWADSSTFAYLDDPSPLSDLYVKKSGLIDWRTESPTFGHVPTSDDLYEAPSPEPEQQSQPEQSVSEPEAALEKSTDSAAIPTSVIQKVKKRSPQLHLSKIPKDQLRKTASTSHSEPPQARRDSTTSTQSSSSNEMQDLAMHVQKISGQIRELEASIRVPKQDVATQTEPENHLIPLPPNTSVGHLSDGNMVIFFKQGVPDSAMSVAEFLKPLTHESNKNIVLAVNPSTPVPVAMPSSPSPMLLMTSQPPPLISSQRVRPQQQPHQALHDFLPMPMGSGRK